MELFMKKHLLFILAALCFIGAAILFLVSPVYAADIKVQRGVIDFGLSADTGTAPITAVNSLDRAFVRITGTGFISHGPTDGDGASKANRDLGATITLTDTTTVTATRHTDGENANYRVYWEVWEDVAQGDNAFIVRDRQTYDMEADTLAFPTMTNPTVGTLADCVVFITGVRSDSASAIASGMTFQGQCNNTTTSFIRKIGGGSAGNNWVSYIAVEFSGANWAVQSNIDHNYFSADATGDNRHVALSPTITWANSFIISQHRAGDAETGQDDVTGMAWPDTVDGSNAQALTSGDVDGGEDIMIHVVSNDYMTVQHLDSVDGGETDLPTGGSVAQEEDRTIDAIIPENTAVIATTISTDANTSYGQFAWGYHIDDSGGVDTDATNLQFWRSRNGGSATEWAAQIITFPPTPTAPTVQDPADQWLPNPTIFWSAYTQTGGDLRDHQKDYEVQIADDGGDGCDADDFTASEYVSPTNADCITNNATCLGAGMAHMVTSTGRYPGTFQNGDSGQTALDTNNTYCIRVRVKGWSPDDDADLGWSVWSSIVTFNTVNFSGNTLYVNDVADGDDTNCQTSGDPCSTLDYALTQAGIGDTILVATGTYNTPVDEISPPETLYIRGATDAWAINPDDADRPLIKSTVAGGETIFKFNNATEAIIEDLRIEGSSTCTDCNVAPEDWDTETPATYGMSTDVPTRVMLVNVDTDWNVTINVVNGSNDFTYWDVSVTGRPTYEWIHTPGGSGSCSTTCDNMTPAYACTVDADCGVEQKRDSSVGAVVVNDAAGNRVTMKGFVCDNCQHSLSFDNAADHALIEEVGLYRSEGHTARPCDPNTNWTIRASTFGDGLEGLNFECGPPDASAITNLVLENNIFYIGLQLGDMGESAGLGYFVAANNIFGGWEGSSRGMFSASEAAGGHLQCLGGSNPGSGCITDSDASNPCDVGGGVCAVGRCHDAPRGPCNGDGDCATGVCLGDDSDIIAATDRTYFGYNVWDIVGSTSALIRWDCEQDSRCVEQGTTYTRCSGSTYATWDGLAFVFDSLSVTRTCANDAPDMLAALTNTPVNNPGQGRIDPTPASASAAQVDTGDPDYYVPSNDAVGGRVDIGPIELTQAAAPSEGSSSTKGGYNWGWWRPSFQYLYLPNEK